jgi:hypothetical protein
MKNPRQEQCSIANQFSAGRQSVTVAD